jgi:deoxycytidylate deaminase
MPSWQNLEVRDLSSSVPEGMKSYDGLIFSDKFFFSPKDVFFEQRQSSVTAAVHEEMDALIKSKGLKNVTINDELYAVTVAANRCMKMTSGKEVIDVWHNPQPKSDSNDF